MVSDPPVWLCVLLGLIAGSFLSCVILRLSQRMSVTGRSICPLCSHPLSAFELIPIMSWIGLGGRCRWCSVRISLFYPLLEVAAGGVAFWGAVSVPSNLRLVTCLLGWTLLALAVVDWRTMTLPNALTLPLWGAGIAVSGILNPASIGGHLSASACAGLLMWALAWIYRRSRRQDGIGMGDAKLFGAGGAWLGFSGLWSVLLIASVSGLAWAVFDGWRKGGLNMAARLPFGSFLSLGIWVVWLYGPVRLG